jgi:hypothetical protein
MTKIATNPRNPFKTIYWFMDTAVVLIWFYLMYFVSYLFGTEFHTYVDNIHARIVYKVSNNTVNGMLIITSSFSSKIGLKCT